MAIQPGVVIRNLAYPSSSKKTTARIPVLPESDTTGLCVGALATTTFQWRRKSPESSNDQPTHFIWLSDDRGKAKTEVSMGAHHMHEREVGNQRIIESYQLKCDELPATLPFHLIA